MKELVLERSTLPPAWAEWFEEASRTDAPSLVTLQRENGGFVLRCVDEVRPEIMAIAEKMTNKYAAVLERLADA